MDAQEIFNTVRDHLLSQKKKSQVRTPGFTLCSYRGKNGLKCAIGCLIPDNVYSEDMEGSEAEELILYSPFEDQFDHLKPYVVLLMDLQNVHDSFYPSQWKQKLDRVAEKHWLES